MILWAPDSELTYSTFATAIGFPMAVILPMIAILSVTSEWSQRSGLTTFTLVPHRGRVISAKAISSVGVGVVSMLLAFAIGAVGNVVGYGDHRHRPGLGRHCRPTWLYIVLGNVLGLLIGFMLGVLIRNSAGAIVAYFVYSFVLPTIFMVLAASQEWFKDLQPWVDFNYAQSALFNGGADRRAVGQPRRHRRDLAGHPAGCRPRPGDAVRGQVADPALLTEQLDGRRRRPQRCPSGDPPRSGPTRAGSA